ncbi:ABC transporter permease [Mucilaginibacter flavidus]|uniref:ABC transporter permease n=1 Tax=Mucilaginibacter flavidus TaxID=2949309 RepID=UPI0020934E81|nr:ABC transporter permease [Mucilaginibacter flavidus]MCO5946732.1 ABC transporter permease [Mucilaginibacter flavidus]
MNAYTFHIAPYDLAFLGTIFIGLTFTLLLWFTKRINLAANRFLGLALATIALQMAWLLGVDIRLGTYFPHWSWLPLQFSLTLGPLIYFYVLKTTRPEYKIRWKDLLHFSPLLLQQAVLGLEIKESIKTGAATYNTLTFQQMSLVLHLAAFISVSTYLYWSFRLIERFYQRLKFNNVRERYRYELRWLYRFLTGFGLLWLLWIPYAAVDYFYYHGQMNIQTCYPLYLFLAIVFIRIAIVSFLRQDVAVPVHAPFVSRPSPPAELKQKGTWLKKVVKENCYYQDPELSLGSLAEKLDLTLHELSRIINAVLKKSFNDFINEYRIAEVIQKMQNPVYDRLTLLGIAFDSGFKSKTTFSRAFRRMTGKTPGEYSSDLKKEGSSYNLNPHSRSSAIVSCHEVTPKWSYEKLNRNFMFRNYLKIAWRNTLHNKVYSMLNITGLAAGMAVALLIGLWVINQYSYDRFLPGYKQLYQVEMNLTSQHNGTSTQTSIALPLTDVLKKEIPGIQYVAEADNIGRMNHGLLVGDKKLYLGGGAVGADFFKIFQYPFVKGNTNSALKDIYSIVITESTAKALFGDADPMGKSIRFDNSQNMTVAGVIRNIPANATLQFNYLVPFAYSEATEGWIKDGRTKWTYNSFSAYVALEPGVTYGQIAPKIRDIVNKRSPEMRSSKPEVIMHPLADWHLYNDFKNGKPAGGFVEYVRLFSIIGMLVLTIACINFMNLSTARSEKRAREVGVRKAIGSARIDLVYQFLLESVLITFISFLLGLLLVQLALPAFNSLTGSAVHIPYGNIGFWGIMVVFVLFTGLVAGSRPAFYLSSFNPVKVLKGSIQMGRWASMPRKVLVVVQFTCSIALIISTVIVYQQIQYVKNRPTGYSADRLMMTDMNSDLSRQYEALKNDLLASGLVESVASSTSPATQVYSHFSLDKWPGKNAGDESVNIGAIWVSEDYFKTLGMTFSGGHNFMGDWKSDTLNVIVNEAMVRRIGLKEPVNQLITINFNPKPVKIIGVVKDALMDSPYSPVEPAVFGHNPFGFVVTYRLAKNAGSHTAIDKIGRIFGKYNPAYPYEYKFVNEEYEHKFNLEVLVGKLAGVFAGLAIFISCLGLFGLAAYVAEQRTKEIGIRKVLGASIAQVWLLLSRDFIVLVVISCVIASPVAFYFLHNWLQKYTYRVGIGVGVFIASGIAAIIITLFTISFQAIKAALTNPVKSLRTE